jgi:hypothetical protein
VIFIFIDVSSSFFLILPHLLFKTILTCFIVLFSYTYTKHIEHIHSPSPSPLTWPLPTGTYSGTGPVFSILPFCRGIFIVKRDFAMVFHTCIYYTLIILALSLTPCSLIIQQLSVLSLCYLHTQMQCISVLFTYHYLFSIISPFFHILLF